MAAATRPHTKLSQRDFRKIYPGSLAWLSWVLAFVGVFYFSLSLSLSLAKKKGGKEFAQVILL
jgi:hypothetical protein